MTSLTFYGGVNEVGGNKILLEDKDTKVFLDFGMSFGKRGAYFDEFMKPRTNAGLKDFMEMGLIPDIKNAYRTDLLKMMDRNDTETDIDGVLLTHAHADHADYISFLNENILSLARDFSSSRLAPPKATSKPCLSRACFKPCVFITSV